jgi:hypothetical protein
MTLFEQYNFVIFILNKDYTGNVVKPDQFKEVVKVANLELFNIMMGLPEDFVPAQPISRKSFDLTKQLNSQLRFLRTYVSAQAVATGAIAISGLTNFYMVDEIRFGYAVTVDGQAQTLYRPVEELTEREYSDRAGNFTKQPTQKNPVYVLRSAAINIYPTTITQVQMSYLRLPTTPVFDYVQETGYITEGPAPTEYEWPENLHPRLTMLIVKYFGMHLSEGDVAQYAELYKQQGV